MSAKSKHIDSQGYVKVRGKHEHRAVMEEMIGRELMAGEEVHHIDFDRSNNAPENLMLVDSLEHKRLHIGSKGKNEGKPCVLITDQVKKLLSGQNFFYKTNNVRTVKYREGDLIYVRENWRKACWAKNKEECKHAKTCNGFGKEYLYEADEDPCAAMYKYRSSLYMPSQAARLFYRITSVEEQELDGIPVFKYGVEK
jgi:hypothetical protein